AEQPAAGSTASAGPAAGRALAAHLDAIEADDGAPYLFTYAGRGRGARVARIRIEMHGQRTADVLERAFDQFDPVEIEDRLLDARKHFFGRLERRTAFKLDFEHDLLRLRRLLGEAADEHPRQ